MRKCRIGTAKFFTLLLLLYHTSIKLQGVSSLDCVRKRFGGFYGFYGFYGFNGEGAAHKNQKRREVLKYAVFTKDGKPVNPLNLQNPPNRSTHFHSKSLLSCHVRQCDTREALSKFAAKPPPPFPISNFSFLIQKAPSRVLFGCFSYSPMIGFFSAMPTFLG